MELDQVLKARRSIRHYQDNPVDLTLVGQMIEAAILSPFSFQNQNNFPSVSNTLAITYFLHMHILFGVIENFHYFLPNKKRHQIRRSHQTGAATIFNVVVISVFCFILVFSTRLILTQNFQK